MPRKVQSPIRLSISTSKRSDLQACRSLLLYAQTLDGTMSEKGRELPQSSDIAERYLGAGADVGSAVSAMNNMRRSTPAHLWPILIAGGDAPS
jgi:hypothetical protein